MQITNREEYAAKVRLIVDELLQRHITRDDAVACLSSTVVIPSDEAHRILCEAVATDISRQKREAGIPDDVLESVGVKFEERQSLLLTGISFRLALGTESLPFLDLNTVEKWQKIAGVAECADSMSKSSDKVDSFKIIRDEVCGGA